MKVAAMLITLKALLRTLILPPAGPLIVAIAGSLLIGRRRRLGGALLTAGLASLWLCATPVVADALSRLAERYPALDLNRAAGAQAIVILGGAQARLAAPEYGGPAAGLELLERVSYGAFVARKTSLPVLVSGMAEETSAMSASLARDYGVSTRWIENQSRDTYARTRHQSHRARHQRHAPLACRARICKRGNGGCARTGWPMGAARNGSAANCAQCGRAAAIVCGAL